MYGIRCQDESCADRYIGETQQILQNYMNQNRAATSRDNDSAVFKQICNAGHTLRNNDVMMLDRDNRRHERGVKPALISRMKKSSRKMMKAVNRSDSLEDFAKVEIFYQELNYQNIVQMSSYEIENLLSDIGGQLGLWLGVSIVALGEIIDFLLSSCHYFLRKMRQRKMENTRSTPILPYRPSETKS